MKNVLFVLKYIMVDTSVLSDTFNLLHGNKNGKLKKKTEIYNLHSIMHF